MYIGDSYRYSKPAKIIQKDMFVCAGSGFKGKPKKEKKNEKKERKEKIKHSRKYIKIGKAESAANTRKLRT